MSLNDIYGQHRRGKADLEEVAPTPEELAWWKTQRRRFVWKWALLGGTPWVVEPIVASIFRHHVSGGDWAHAVWMTVAFGGLFGWMSWRSAEPATCAREIRARRLRLALLNPAPAPDSENHREPVRLIPTTKP